MRLVASFSDRSARLRGPKFYTNLPDSRLRGRNFRDALLVADQITAKYRDAKIGTLYGKARERREVELMAVAVMLHRMGELSDRWYTPLRAHNARQQLIAARYAALAGVLCVGQVALATKVQQIRQANAAA